MTDIVKIAIRTFFFFTSCFLFANAILSQVPPARSDASIKLAADTEKVKKQIVKIDTGNDITIVRRDGQAFHGQLLRIDSETVTIDEVDLRAKVEINFQQIVKVEKGYGPANKITGHRASNKTRNIVRWVAFGGLAVLITAIIVGLRDPNF